MFRAEGIVEIAPGEPFRGAFENTAGLGIHVQNPQIGAYDDHAIGQRFEDLFEIDGQGGGLQGLPNF
jgi:hypothetical protein